jgi:hypothetical protein
MNSICWRTPTTPMPMENRPRVLFERLFGDAESTEPAARLRRVQQDRSILDSVTKKANALKGDLGATDRLKVNEYLDAVRDVERRIQLVETQVDRKLPKLVRPAGVPETFTEHARMMFDLQVLAYQTDLTRVITFMVGREFGGRTYQEIGIPEGYHALTHHQYNPEKIAKVIQIQIYHARHLAYYLEKLRSTPDGDGSLLDHMMVLYGGGLSDGNSHLHDNLPTMLVGGASGQLKGGRHIRLTKETPMTNLMLTMLDMLGVQEKSLGDDSTGRLALLHPGRKLRLVELVVLVDVEVAHVLVLGFAGRDGTQRCTAEEAHLHVAREHVEREEEPPAFDAEERRVPLHGLFHVRNGAHDERVEALSEGAFPARHRGDVGLHRLIAVAFRDLRIAAREKGDLLRFSRLDRLGLRSRLRALRSATSAFSLTHSGPPRLSRAL